MDERLHRKIATARAWPQIRIWLNREPLALLRVRNRILLERNLSFCLIPIISEGSAARRERNGWLAEPPVW